MKRISTIIPAVLLLLTISIGLVGCDDDNTDITEIDLDPAEITAAILEAGEFPEMVEHRMDNLGVRHYHDIDDEAVVDISHWFTPAGAAPDIVTVIKTDTIANANSVKAFVESWLQEQIDDTLGSYHPGQAQKTENMIVESRANYVVVLICEDSESALKVFNGFF
jgi:hypothetical protein